MKVRVAFGTGVVLGLWRGKLSVSPTTAHLLTYYPARCTANCGFCAQARGSTANPDWLSRVPWPAVELERFVEAMGRNRSGLKRICCQAMNFPGAVETVRSLVSRLRGLGLPISVCCQPLSRTDLKELVEAGADRVCIPLDAATPEVFERVKGRGAGGPYRWEEHWASLEEAVRLVRGRVTTHLIVGLGERENEMVETMERLQRMGVSVALFAFTPIPGTALEFLPPPPLETYRKMQLARYLLERGIGCVRTEGGAIRFEGDRVLQAVRSGDPFLTSGCPDCNRPFYNESPRGPLYNFPRRPTPAEVAEIERLLLDEIGAL
jgi:biotin synthase